MTDFSRDELMEMAPLFAVGATTPEEAAALESAMRSDPALAAEVAAFREVAATVATATPVAPSAGLRAELLAAVSKSAPTSVPRSRSATAPVTPARRPAWLPAALAASLLAAAGLGTYSVRLSSELHEARAAVGTLDARLQERERTLNTLLDAERDLRVAYLQGDAGPTGPGIQFFWNLKQGRAIAHVFRLKPAPDGRDYQIWALVDGKPVSLSVFNSDADGRALVQEFTLPGTIAGVSAVLVSVEPKGGSVQPTTTPFLAGSFSGS